MPDTPPGYRVIQLIGRDPPPEILRHAAMTPGEAGRYARVVRFRHDASQTVYEVLHFKAGRPPTREEVLADLRADLDAVDRALTELQQGGKFGAWVDARLFAGVSRADLERRRKDIVETMESVTDGYAPGEAVIVP